MSLAHCQVGYSTISISGFQAMLGFLRTYGHLDSRTKTGWNMGTTPQQLAASFVNFGMIFGILCAGPLGKYISRRHGLWLACLVSVLGSGLQLKNSHVAGLYARRVIIGMSNGMFTTFANTYTAECAPKGLKAKLASLYGVSVCFGGLLGSITNNFTAHLHTPWAYKIPLTCHMAIPSILVVLITFIPRSPRWLLVHGRADEARRSLDVLRGRAFDKDTLDEEFSQTRTSVNTEKDATQEHRYTDMFKRADRRKTLLCLAVTLSNSASGIWLMLSYGTVVFQLADVKAPFQASIFSNLAHLIGALVGLYLRSKLGRRSMLMTGHFVPGLCMLGVGVSFTLKPDSGLASSSRAAESLIIAHGFFYYAFAFSISGTLCSELVSQQQLRSITADLATWLNHITAWLVAFTTPYFINAERLGWGPKVAYIWAASNLIRGVLLLFFLLPETQRYTEE
ncbi:hypothetical protein LZ554_001585 [Drepanopeziza brunnea f. sp. 'monogermtubi']|nr:hypothetical protein LZ554_001585 [Drepanopeziza brunnea f. sp. 'monogermtubi']